MGLFDKKYCGVCGERIHLFGNRKLSDGNLCKDCESKLSPWFSERRESTLEEIKEQIDYRENNKAAVATFHTTRSLGTYTKILFDEDQQKFMVTSASNLEKANPDVMDFSQITGCNIDIRESKSEMKCKDAEGNSVSYNPPQYSSDYDFYVVLNVNNPYFNEIRFKLNNSDITIEPEIRLAAQMPQQAAQPMRQGMPQQNRPGMPQQNRPGMPQQAAQPSRPGMPQPSRPGMPQQAAQPSRPGMPQQTAQPSRPGMPQQNRPGMPQQAAQPARSPMPQQTVQQPQANNQVISSFMMDPMNNSEYYRFWQMGEEIKSILLGVHDEMREQAAAAHLTPQAVTCPWCGATTIPTANGCCEYCGGAVY